MKKLILIASLLLFSAGARAQECANYSPPRCEQDERIFLDVEANGCRVPHCGKVKPFKPSEEFQPEGCPSLVVPKCKDGEVRQDLTDHNRCPYTLCEPAASEE